MKHFFKILLIIFILTSCSEQAEKYLENGKKELQKGDYASAEKSFRKSAKLNPNNKLASYFEKFTQKQIIMNYEGSIEDLDKIIQIDPTNGLAYEQRAKMKYFLGDKEGAINDLNELIKINPNYDNVYMNRGRIKASISDSDAIKDFNKSIELNPSSFSSYSARAKFKYILGDKKGAIDDFKKALETKKGLKDSEFFVIQGQIKSILGDKKGAIDDFYKALEIKEVFKDNEFYSAIYTEIGKAKGSIIIEGKSNNYSHKDVVESFDKAVNLSPQIMYFLQLRGISKYFANDYQGSLIDLTQVIQTKNAINSGVDLASVYYFRSLSEISLNLYDEALNDLNKTLELDPNNLDAISKRELVKKGKCSIQFVKSRDHGYSKSFYGITSKACDINSNSSKENKTLLLSILNQLKQYSFYKENCPRCSIDIYTNMKALEYDYKIMNWSFLGIDHCSYSKLRYDGKMQKLLKEHLVLSFNDFKYGQYGNEEILTYPCQKNGHCENRTRIPESIRSMCNF